MGTEPELKRSYFPCLKICGACHHLVVVCLIQFPTIHSRMIGWTADVFFLGVVFVQKKET